MRALVSTLASALVLAIAPVGAAEHNGPDGDCQGLVVPVGDAAYLVVEEVAGDTYLVSAWLIAESNGIPGCQWSDQKVF